VAQAEDDLGRGQIDTAIETAAKPGKTATAPCRQSTVRGKPVQRSLVTCRGGGFSWPPLIKGERAQVAAKGRQAETEYSDCTNSYTGGDHSGCVRTARRFRIESAPDHGLFEEYAGWMRQPCYSPVNGAPRHVGRGSCCTHNRNAVRGSNGTCPAKRCLSSSPRRRCGGWQHRATSAKRHALRKGQGSLSARRIDRAIQPPGRGTALWISSRAHPGLLRAAI
jgi:hypothetical protein